MGFMRNGVYVNSEPVTLIPATTRNAGGTGGQWDAGGRSTLRLSLVVSALSGALPVLDVILETSADAVTWYEIGRFAQRMTPGVEQKSFAGLDRYVRARWTLGGTLPSGTFGLAGEAI